MKYPCECDLTDEEFPIKLDVSAHIEVYLDREGKVTSVGVMGSPQGDCYPYPFMLRCNECGEDFDQDDPHLPYEEMGRAMEQTLERMLLGDDR